MPGKRNSAADQELLNKILSALLELGAELIEPEEDETEDMPEGETESEDETEMEGETEKGSASSGNWGHAGRPGSRGGSGAGGGFAKIGASGRDDLPRALGARAAGGEIGRQQARGGPMGKPKPQETPGQLAARGSTLGDVPILDDAKTGKGMTFGEMKQGMGIAADSTFSKIDNVLQTNPKATLNDAMDTVDALLRQEVAKQFGFKPDAFNKTFSAEFETVVNGQKALVRVGRDQWGDMARIIKNQLRAKYASQKETSAKESTPSSFTVYKDKSGRYRWLAVSSSAYQDRDGEWVTQKALEADVTRANQDRKFGPLRYAHAGFPDPVTKTAGPGLDIGDCDFNTIYGPFLVESGTFRNETIGEKAAQFPPMGLSIGFFHPAGEPKNGEYSSIHRFERSLLPAGRESNMFTSFLVMQGAKTMTDKSTATAELTALLGADLATKVAAQLEQQEQKATGTGVTMKEKIGEIFKNLRGETKPAPVTEPAVEPAQKAATIGEMTAEQFAAVIKSAVTPAQPPAPVAPVTHPEADTIAALKEAAVAQNARIATLETSVKTLLDELETLVGKPGYRPTLDPATVKATPAGVTGGVDPSVAAWLNMAGGAK